MPRRGRKSRHVMDESKVAVNVNGVDVTETESTLGESSRSSDCEDGGQVELISHKSSSSIPNCLAKGELITTTLETVSTRDCVRQMQSDDLTAPPLVSNANAVIQIISDDAIENHTRLNDRCDSESETGSTAIEPSSPPADVHLCDDNVTGDSAKELDEQQSDIVDGPSPNGQSGSTNALMNDSAYTQNVSRTELRPKFKLPLKNAEVCSSIDDDHLQVTVDGVSSEKFHSRLETLAETCRLQQSEIERISEENRLLRESASTANDISASSSDMTVLPEETADIYEVQMAALEKTITQLQREVETQRDRYGDQEDASSLAIAQLRRELGGRLDKVTRQLEIVVKEKESVVVKYAQSEATVLSLKKTIDENDRKFKDFARERDTLLNKVRQLTADKSRLSHAVDTKSSEVGSIQRDSERLREEISSKDIKIKWAHNRMKTEMDAHKDTLGKLERTEQKLRETREEAEQVRRDCQEMIRTYQESEEIKSNSLDIQLRVKETELKMERQEKSTKEEVQQMMKQELESVKSKLKMCIDENNCLTIKLQTLERERLDYEGNLGRMKEQSNSGLQEIVDLQARLAEMDNLMVQINREREKVFAGQTEIERLRQSNAELQIDMEACRRKEGELLEFTERLTGKNVSLQSEFSCLEAKCQALQREVPTVRKQCDEFEQQKMNLTSELMEEQEQHKKETHLLARKLAEKTKTIETLNIKLEEQVNENRVLRRKNASTVRELSREIQSLRRRLDAHEANSRGNLDSQSLGSRASSTTSLDALGQREQPINGQLAHTAKSSSSRDGHDRGEDCPAPVQPTQEMLIERIVKLQRAHARKNEKIEFLEEHVNQLVSELKKKSRLIQNYVIREDSGTLSTVSMDQYKDGKNKLDLSRRGGIMASLYNSHQSDNGLTLDLSLEISRKLQAVLEDTLLKNITLKENIKTLGDEIARLSMERRQL